MHSAHICTLIRRPAHVFVTPEVMQEPMRSGQAAAGRTKALDLLDLSQASLGQYPLQTRLLDIATTRPLDVPHLRVNVRNLLDSASLARPSVFRRDHASVRALAELFHELVFRVDDERRVEGLEGVPLHGVWRSRRVEMEGIGRAG